MSENKLFKQVVANERTPSGKRGRGGEEVIEEVTNKVTSFISASCIEGEPSRQAFQSRCSGTSLVSQELRLPAPNSGGGRREGCGVRS